ncbi:MAG: tetratricopeptide repeat protein [Verrucomicrobiota bacterium]|jgi:tetratricopeptide (TPR) repeat protein|nr:tetratricopeptide repeat protein [Verrucomicrobiota bacterium]
MNMQKFIPLVLVISLTAAAALAAPYVVLSNGTRVEGTAIRSLANGDINLTIAGGVRTFPKGSYRQAVAEKPAEYAQAEQAYRASNFDQAVRLLSDVITRNRNLSWDVQGTKLLAQVLADKGDYDAAVQAYERLFQMDPAERQNGETLWGMRRAMLGARQYSALIRQLDAVAATGSRPDAARAQTMRGDIQLAQNNIDAAVLDYLRTALLFTDIRDANILGEACFKAAQTLEQLRDPRAKEMYRKVTAEYSASPYAAQARAKM